MIDARGLILCGLLIATSLSAAPAPAPDAAASALAPAPGERWLRLADPVFQHLSLDNGLPSLVTTALAEDGDGFIWVGTQDGLSRWDGYRFRIYQPDTALQSGLTSYFIQCLHTDRNGRLWVGTSGGGVARYDRDAERFVTIAAGPNGLSHASVRAVADDGAGGVWVGTDGGLDHIDPATGAVEHARAGEPAGSGLPDEHITALLLERDGALWVGTQKGLVRRDVGAKAFGAVALPASAGHVPAISSLFEASDGKVWIGTASDGAFVYDARSGLAQALAQVDSSDPALASDWVYAIAEAGTGEIWLGTFGQGIVAVDSATLKSRRIRHEPTLPTSLADNTLWALLRDRAGLVWIGTQRGLSRHDPAQAAVLPLLGGSSRPDGITDSDVRSVLALADGTVWLGLAHNGVDILDPNGVRSGGIRPGPGRAESALPNERVLALAAAPDGAVFVGTDRGVYRAEPGTHAVQRLALSAPNPIPEVRALLVDGDRLWIGGPQGLWMRGLTSPATTPGAHVATERMTDQRVMALERGPAGSIWIGTRNGLNRYDPVTHEIEAIPGDPGEAGALSTGFVMSLLTDRSGRLWVGTLSGGLCILEARDAQLTPRFRCIGTADGLPNPDVAQMLLGSDGNVWMSSDNGLASIDPNTLAVRSMQRAEGVVITSYWSNSGAVTPQGELLFGGLGGLTVVRAERVKDWSYRPPVVVTDVRVGGKPVAASRFNGAAADATLEPLRIAAEANSFAVEFSALDYSAPDRNRYAYMLEGFDKDWVSTDPTRRLASYTNLPPGDYRLRLRGSNRTGAWTEKELVLPIRTLPAWYQTWWFRAVVLLALALAVFALVRWRTATLQFRQRELEQKVRERTAELESTSRALQENSRALEENSRALERNSRSLEEKSRALEEASLTDPLTGMRNRRFLTQHVASDTTLSIRRHEEHAAGDAAPPEDCDLIFFLADIDHFKHVNDVYGHAAGDAILMQMRQRLRKVFHETDYLIRWGGEEFLVVARATNREQGAALAERVRRSVADEQFSLDDKRSLSKTCSVGFACFPFLLDSPRTLAWLEVIEIADLALYAAKRSGRDAWVGLTVGAGVRREGLMQRIRTAPAEAIVERELEIASSLALERVTTAIGQKGPE